jgi:hypothetical protein
MNLLWDGSDIGDISEYFVSIQEPENGKIGCKIVLRIDDKEIMCFAWKYRNNIPLLIDELKPLFGIPKIGRHKCIIHDNELLISQCINKDENIYDPTIHHCAFDKLEEVVTLRYILGIVTTGNYFWYRPKCGILLYRDVTIDFHKESSKMRDSYVKKYFDNDRQRVKLSMIRLLKKSCVSEMANSLSPTHLIRIQQLLRIKIEETIRRIDPNYIMLCVSILSRIQNILGEQNQ